ncbi:MAG: PD-(D/E)XK nuclease family protein [Dehalococcoidia bacterium]|nr:MAG: PD-(D/E)XK nuclease family protein [Dehalococcoidia bacterium]
MFEASSYKLNMFQQCPRRYKFQYIDGLIDIYRKPRPYFTMGDHVHAALKDFMSTVPTCERNISKLEHLLREKWQRNRKGFTDKEDEKRWGEKALNQLRWFAQSQDLSVTPLMVEKYHKVELSTNISLAGRIDRVDQEVDGSLHVIDYKTGKMLSEPNQTQLHIYALILSKEQDLPISKVSCLYLEVGKFQTLKPTTADLDQVASYIIDLVDRIRMEREYSATPNNYCGTCDFLEICPNREEAAKLIVSEDEIDF